MIEPGEPDDLERQRTNQQNKCLHKYATCLSDEMNAAGYDVQTVITCPVQFTPETIWEYFVKPVMTALYPEKTSTTELNTKEIQVVYENLNKLTGEKFGISLMFPDRFNGGKCK